jgi:malonyl-CoA O-methyltransferase
MTLSDDSPVNNVRDVRRRFDRAAPHFDTADFVHSVTRNGLLERLDPILIDAKTVVDLGSATGSGSRLLAKRFRRALVISTDLSLCMLEQGKAKKSWFDRTSAVQANATALPFAHQSIDIMFANLLLPWIGDPSSVFAEVSRVLRKDGLFLFATLGPDSLGELRHAWSCVDQNEHTMRFPDMHNIGDAIVRAGLRDPVLDVDRLVISYENSTSLFRDLTAMGARNSLSHRERSLGGAARFKEMSGALDTMGRDGRLTLDLELVYGHCWGSGSPPDSGEIQVPITNIGRRR